MGFFERLKSVAKETANKGGQRLRAELIAAQERRREEKIREDNYKAIERAAYSKAFAEERVKQAVAKGKATAIKRAKEGTTTQKIIRFAKNIQMPDLLGDVNLAGHNIQRKKKKSKR